MPGAKWDANEEMKTEIFAKDGVFFNNLREHPNDLQDITDQVNNSLSGKISGELTPEQVLELLSGEESTVTID